MRTALAIGRPDLAERLVDGYQPRYRYAEHALVAATAALAEAHCHHQAAADGYTEAAKRWQHFGVVPEQAFALLGRGRCLVALERPVEAADSLRRAREVFELLGAAPALAETDALLQQATAVSAY